MANPIVIHIDAMLNTFDPNVLRAVYMVVKVIYDLQKQQGGIQDENR